MVALEAHYSVLCISIEIEGRGFLLGLPGGNSFGNTILLHLRTPSAATTVPTWRQEPLGNGPAPPAGM